jgi:hypothetical protein
MPALSQFIAADIVEEGGDLTTEIWVSKSCYPRVMSESQGPAALAFRVSRPFPVTTCDNRLPRFVESTVESVWKFRDAH